jgi:hypothetical protein
VTGERGESVGFLLVGTEMVTPGSQRLPGMTRELSNEGVQREGPEGYEEKTIG